MKNWSAGEWSLFFGAISANVILIIHALASWLGRKETSQQNQTIIKEVAEVKGKLEGTGNGAPV